ncbi:arrestin domain-containing protein 17 [Plodia interpunctella]|uniref:arrestin domain-containing protein 17 n=1 Tax=Plodia interpunctella TaxID=58824 RepID=UPI0023686B8F|nr:arrestin domain-containing protein 17 [Plodia interpunctella]XP_053613183.1 arrestin domain-containing protein 17 [Plodia interpunctella]
MPRKLLKFLIVFDNTSLLYFPGQFLSGKVLMELQDDTPVLGLHFHVIGEGVVRVGSGRHERLYDKENYIDFRMRLLGEPGHSTSILSPGIHSFPFKLGLPMGLPSTFLGTHGWVQYYCKAALREPNGLTHKNQQVFIVMNPIDLNLEPPVLSQEFECSVEHKLGVGCVGGGVVSCRVSLDRGAFVPGESIALSASVVNNSRTTIRSTRATLTETIQYSAHGKVAAREARALATLRRGALAPGAAQRWLELLYVPPLPPTNLRGCHLISVQYDVFFIIEPKSLEKEIKLQLPILLGTYPFRDSEDPRHPPTIYPSTLPIFRPWLHEKPAN